VPSACILLLLLVPAQTYPRTYVRSYIYIYTHYNNTLWTAEVNEIPPPVVKIIVSVRSPAGVIYDRGSRVLADQWARLWGLGTLYAHSHTLYVYNISMCVCVCVCVTCPSIVFISLLCIIQTESEWINIYNIIYALDANTSWGGRGTRRSAGQTRRKGWSEGVRRGPLICPHCYAQNGVSPPNSCGSARTYIYIYIHIVIYIIMNNI